MTLTTHRPTGRPREPRSFSKKDKLKSDMQVRDQLAAVGRIYTELDRDDEKGAWLKGLTVREELIEQLDRLEVLSHKLFPNTLCRRDRIGVILADLIDNEKTIKVADSTKEFWRASQLTYAAIKANEQAAANRDAAEVAAHGKTSRKAEAIAYQKLQEQRALENRSHAHTSWSGIAFG